MKKSIKDRKSKMKTRKDRYVLGWIQNKNCVYGKEGEVINWIDPLTAFQAKRAHRHIVDEDLGSIDYANFMIFELVPVDPDTLK